MAQAWAAREKVRVPVDPTETRESLILAAERLFAERGYGAVSLREILVAAGQRNKSAAHYHFGSKEGLLAAIFDYRTGPVDARRREMLAALDQGGRAYDLRGVLEAFVYPIAERVSVDGSWYARFVAQVVFISGIDPLAPQHQAVTQGFVDVIARLQRLLRRMPDEIRQGRLDAALGLAFQALAQEEQRRTKRATPHSTMLVAANVVDMQEAMLLAPTSPTTRRKLRQIRRPRSPQPATSPPGAGGNARSPARRRPT